MRQQTVECEPGLSHQEEEDAEQSASSLGRHRQDNTVQLILSQQHLVGNVVGC